jgi:hypothetical protein
VQRGHQTVTHHFDGQAVLIAVEAYRENSSHTNPAAQRSPLLSGFLAPILT